MAFISHQPLSTTATEGTNHRFRDEMLGLYEAFDQFQFDKGVWSGSYRGNISISLQNLVRQTFKMSKQLASYQNEPGLFSADFLTSVLQEATAPVPFLSLDVKSESGPDQAQDELQVVESARVGEGEKEMEDDKLSLVGATTKKEENRCKSRGTFSEDRHQTVFTKHVPPAVVFAIRGVQCRVCGQSFRSPKCLDELIRHMKRLHPQKATAKHIRAIRLDNTFENLIGNGMPYCTCHRCRVIGPASFDTSFYPVGPKRSLKSL